jgi:hypothetical protein
MAGVAASNAPTNANVLFTVTLRGIVDVAKQLNATVYKRF